MRLWRLAMGQAHARMLRAEGLRQRHKSYPSCRILKFNLTSFLISTLQNFETQAAHTSGNLSAI